MVTSKDSLHAMREPADGAHLPDDQFIPVRAEELVHRLAAGVGRSGDGPIACKGVATAIERIVMQEAVSFERVVSSMYSRVDPDRETLIPSHVPADPNPYEALDRKLSYLLTKASFKRLDEVQIAEAIAMATSSGVKVRIRPELVDSLTLWVRGRSTEPRRFRNWRHPIRGVPHQINLYRRLVVIGRLKDDPHVFLKLFRDIPAMDIEALLPHAEVRMNWFDRMKVWGGGAGALGSVAIKIIKGAVSLAYLSQFLWVLLSGCALLAIRAFFGYRRARVSRDWQRTRHLYFQSLGNNTCVLHRLISMVAQEEIKEAVLVWSLCARAGSNGFATKDELCHAAESYLQRTWKVSVRFDIDDALETMDRLDLWSDRTRFVVRQSDQVCEMLGSHWVERRSRDYHRNNALATDAHKPV